MRRAKVDIFEHNHRCMDGDTGRAFPFRIERNGSKTENTVDHRVGINGSDFHLAACVAGLGIVRR